MHKTKKLTKLVIVKIKDLKTTNRDRKKLINKIEDTVDIS